MLYRHPIRDRGSDVIRSRLTMFRSIQRSIQQKSSLRLRSYATVKSAYIEILAKSCELRCFGTFMLNVYDYVTFYVTLRIPYYSGYTDKACSHGSRSARPSIGARLAHAATQAHSGLSAAAGALALSSSHDRSTAQCVQRAHLSFFLSFWNHSLSFLALV